MEPDPGGPGGAKWARERGPDLMGILPPPQLARERQVLARPCRTGSEAVGRLSGPVLAECPDRTRSQPAQVASGAFP